MSRDGRTVIAQTYDTNGRLLGDPPISYRWTRESGNTPITTFSDFVHFVGVANDGSVAVGTTVSGPDSALQVNAVRLVGDFYAPLGPSNSTLQFQQAFAVSADGWVAAGIADTAQNALRAVVWPGPGLEVVLPSPGRAAAYDLSASGSRVVGAIESAGVHAAYWDNMQAPVLISTDANLRTECTGVSADGQTIVGYATNFEDNITRGFRWTAEQGFVVLDDGETRLEQTLPQAVSADGRAMVGVFAREELNVNGSFTDAFYWDDLRGFRTLKSVLLEVGLPVDNYRFSSSYWLSDDGLTVAGSLYGPDRTQGFVARIPTPAPAAAFGLAAWAIGLGRRRNGTGATPS